jgi:hypothetical protein
MALAATKAKMTASAGAAAGKNPSSAEAGVTRCGGSPHALPLPLGFAFLARANACFPVFFLLFHIDLRQRHRHRGSQSGRAFDGHSAAMQFDQPLYQAEAESRPFILPRVVVADLGEGLTDSSQLLSDMPMPVSETRMTRRPRSSGPPA